MPHSRVSVHIYPLELGHPLITAHSSGIAPVRGRKLSGVLLTGNNRQVMCIARARVRVIYQLLRVQSYYRYLIVLIMLSILLLRRLLVLLLQTV